MENSMESPSKLGIKLPFAVLAVFSHSAAFVSDSLKLHGTSVHGDSPGKNTGVGCHALRRGSSPPRDRTQVCGLQVDSLPAEPPWKPKNTGVGRLSLLQGIFLTQESNQGLLHCRWILYQLSYQGSPLRLFGYK